ETAAIHFLNEGIATPTTAPPLPFEQGVDRAPTLVQNVETLAHIALIARGGTPSSTLITLAGGIARPGVLEVELGTSIGDAVRQGGGVTEQPKAVLVGGYFGSWMEPAEAWKLPLDHRARLGCGVIGLLPASACPVCETAGIMRYLAAESSAQCGPCFFGLRALADACTRIADNSSDGRDLRIGPCTPAPARPAGGRGLPGARHRAAPLAGQEMSATVLGIADDRALGSSLRVVVTRPKALVAAKKAVDEMVTAMDFAASR